MKSPFVVSAVAALALSLIPASAQAGKDSVRMSGGWDSESIEVFYGDLNLDSKYGANSLLRRIKSAAERACGKPSKLADVRALQKSEKCIDAATRRAVRQVNEPLVTRIYREDLADRVASR